MTMLHSESIKELATALAKAQGELIAPKKDTENPYFKSKYANLAGHVEQIKACFPKYGLSYTQAVVTSDNRVGVETMIMHSSGEWVRHEPCLVPVSKADAQGFGSVITYMRRYALSAAVGTAQDDDDANAGSGPAKPPAAPTNTLERIQSTDPGNARRATTDAFDALPEEAQQVTREWAMEVVAYLSTGDVASAFDFIEAQDMDSEGKMALWSLLDSKARSAIKKEQERRRIAGVKKVPMAEQA
jgi:hypothetical protein